MKKQSAFTQLQGGMHIALAVLGQLGIHQFSAKGTAIEIDCSLTIIDDQVGWGRDGHGYLQ